jgi:flagellar hook-associated protein 3 FlgL
MRITFNGQFNNTAAALSSASDRLAEAQRQVASGRRIDRASDDPTGAAAAVSERAHLASVDQYSRSADSSTARLSVIDTVLTGIIEKITAAQTTVFAARNSTSTPSQRDAAADTLTGIRDSLVDDMNTSFHGTYVFSGNTVTTAPYTPTAGVVNAYAGSATEVQVDISQTRPVTVGFDGSTIVDAGSAGTLFSVLDALGTALKANDQNAVAANLLGLQQVFVQMNSAQSRVGLSLNTIESEQARLAQTKLATTARLTQLEEVNMATAISDMNQADVTYRAALSAAAKNNSVSLLDYLR